MFQNKNANLILSLVITIFLWGYVLVDVNPSQDKAINNIPVKIQNQETLLQRGLALNNEDYLVNISVTGKRSDLLKMDIEKITAVMDVYGYAMGINYVPVKIELPDGINLTGGRIPKLEVLIEEYAVKTKSVEISYLGDIPPDQEPSNITVNPNLVEIKGAKSKVESVAKVLAQVPLEEWAVKGESIISLICLDQESQEVKGVKLSSNTATVSGGLLYVKTVPLEVPIQGEISSDYDLESFQVPTKVILTGEKEALEAVKGVTASTVDLSVVKGTMNIPVEIELPPGVYLSAKADPLQVIIKLKGEDSKSFDIPSSRIIFQNLGQGYSAYINTEGIQMTLIGDREILDSVRLSDDFTVYLELEGLIPGTYSVPVKVRHNLLLSSLELEPAELQVTITAPTEAF